MNTLEKLLSRRWFVKAVNKEEYYQIKDEIGQYQDFLSEKLGYHLIVNPYVIKLEKIPAVPENWMGIMEFTEPLEYIFFCLVLMFLEDKEIDGQFILSQLTEFISSTWKKETVDWTLYQNRRCLVKVLKYCVGCGILQAYDGSEDSFKNDSEADVLYLNTGVSRYFMRNFTTDITSFISPEDFSKEDWFGMDEDRGIVRRQRVYRRLLMTMGVQRTQETEEDFSYIRQYGKRNIEKDFSQYLDCELQIYKNQAFLVLGEECSMGRCFPEANSMSDIVLLCGKLVRERVEKNIWKPDMQDVVFVQENEMLSLLEECKQTYQAGFVKLYREMTTKEFCRKIMDELQQMEFIEKQDGQIKINAVFCRVTAVYPADFEVHGQSDKE